MRKSPPPACWGAGLQRIRKDSSLREQREAMRPPPEAFGMRKSPPPACWGAGLQRIRKDSNLRLSVP
jgi:hypothetical protein